MDSGKYTKKPIVVEAIKFEYDNGLIKEIKKKFKGIELDYIGENWMVKTIEGWIKVKDGDYVVKGIDGEFYPCKSDIFERTYKKIEK